MLKNLLLLSGLLFYLANSNAQTVGLIEKIPGSYDNGYILFSPLGSKTTYLIDKCGRQVHSWQSTYRPGLSVYLLPDGSILRTGQTTTTHFLNASINEKIDWDGNVEFSYLISDSMESQHHDIRPMPNGNFLAIYYESKTEEEALAAGRNPLFLGDELWPEKILELHPVDSDHYNIVWEWHTWDHLVQRYDSSKANYGLPKDHPELINLNYIRNKNPELYHFNSIDYNPELDQILISSHIFNEIWVIDHSTTTAEAASHTGGKYGKGGDLLYRWGNPEAYNRGTTSNKKFFGQHDAKWIPKGLRYAGSIMVFNNGLGRGGDYPYSSVEIITPPVFADGEYDQTLPYLPAKQSWIYSDSIPQNFIATNISGAQQLKNGNILVCDGPSGTFFEIDTLGNKVWKYVNPDATDGIAEQGTPLPIQNNVFKCIFYPMDYPAFQGHVLVGKDPIELNPWTYFCQLDIKTGYEFSDRTDKTFFYQDFDQINITTAFQQYKVSLVNIYGQEVFTARNINQINTSAFRNGAYILSLYPLSGNVISKKIIIEN
jgi:hypothetical protein